MSHLTLEQMAAQTLQRVVRLETRMVQLGDHVGANLREKQRIDVVTDDDGVAVFIDAMDVSLSRILEEVKQHNAWVSLPAGRYDISIRLGDWENWATVGTLYLDRV